MDSPESITNIDYSIINIITDQDDEAILSLEKYSSDVAPLAMDIERKFNQKILRLNRQKAKVAFQIMGCKASVASSLAEKIFEHYQICAKKTKFQPNQDTSKPHRMYTTRENFLGILRKFLHEHSLTKEQNIFDFELAMDIIEQNKSMIVLLGGTSGCGKSTVASLLASRFGISTVLSTDSIRHVMRNFMSTDEYPVLFASTYEVGSKIKFEEDVPEKKKIVLGFRQQAQLIQQRLESILDSYYNKGESVVIEGVHLTPEFMISMIKKYTNCLPFIIYISNESKHRERFAVRSKYMTLDKRTNKYVQNFGNIRTIQKHLIKTADKYLIPKVDNSNIDKSVGLVHRTMIRCLRRIVLGEKLFDPEKNNTLMLYENFNQVSKNVWSSDAVRKYITQKATKVHKNELLKRFFGEDANNSHHHPREKHLDKNDNDDRDDSPLRDNINESDKIEVKEINEAEVDVELIDGTPKNTKSQFTFKEDFLLEGSENGSLRKPTLERLSSSKKSESIKEKPSVVEDSDDSEGRRKDHVKVLEETKEPHNTFPQSQEMEENKEQENASTPTFTQPKTHLRFQELEDLLNTKKIISLKGNITLYHIRIVKRFVANYNKKKADSYLRLYQTNERYIIYKQSKNAGQDSPYHSQAIPLKPNEHSLRTLSKFKKDELSVKIQDSDKTGKSAESNTSEADQDHSEDDVSISSAERSNFSGSLDNWHLTKRGSTNITEKLEISDDFESRFEDDDNTDEHTSIEILESANSISEQTEEDDEEDEVIGAYPAKTRSKVLNNS